MRSRSSISCSSSISPTNSSKISSIVTKPHISPYSSITTAKCDLSFLNSSRSESARFVSGTTFASLIIESKFTSSFIDRSGNRSFAKRIPSTFFFFSFMTGYLEWPDSITVSSSFSDESSM